MGPAGKTAAVARVGVRRVPESDNFNEASSRMCNWLQALEVESIQATCHFFISSELESDPLFKGAKGNQYNLG